MALIKLASRCGIPAAKAGDELGILGCQGGHAGSRP